MFTTVSTDLFDIAGAETIKHLRRYVECDVFTPSTILQLIKDSSITSSDVCDRQSLQRSREKSQKSIIINTREMSSITTIIRRCFVKSCGAIVLRDRVFAIRQEKRGLRVKSCELRVCYLFCTSLIAR